MVELVHMLVPVCKELQHILTFTCTRVQTILVRNWNFASHSMAISTLKYTGLLHIGMERRNGPWFEGSNVTVIARLHFKCSRPHQKQSAAAATSNTCCSQPSGKVYCSQWWVSTGHSKLKAISRR